MPYLGSESSPQIYLAGDVSDRRAILHEAADEGHIAGYNSVHDKEEKFDFRVPIEIVFSQPNIARVGLIFKEVQNKDHVIGEAYFDDQGRARIMSQNKGVLRLYTDASTKQLLGSEMCMPAGEHIAHLLAWSIKLKLTAFEMLKMPFVMGEFGSL